MSVPGVMRPIHGPRMDVRNAANARPGRGGAMPAAPGPGVGGQQPVLGPGTAEARRVQDARAAEAPEEKRRARRCHPLL